MPDSIFSLPGKIAYSLCEVVDEDMKPLCLMNVGDILRQGLRHRACALLLRGRSGRFLLRLAPSGGFGFSSFSPSPAGSAARDAALRMLWEDWGLEGADMSFRGIFPPLPENRLAFTAIFEAKVSEAILGQLAGDLEKTMPATAGEILALAARGDVLDPFLALALGRAYVKIRQ